MLFYNKKKVMVEKAKTFLKFFFQVVPSRQQQLELPIVALETCSKIYGRVIPITTNQLCVGGEAKKDACSGFGGAPLVLLDHVLKDRYYQVRFKKLASSTHSQNVYTLEEIFLSLRCVENKTEGV